MFFYLSKIVWALVDPGNAFLIALIIGLLLLATRFRKLGKTIIFADLLFALIITLLPIGPWMHSQLENRFDVPSELPEDISGIIVLGGVIQPELSALRKTPVINGAIERVTISASLARAYPDAKLIFSGGSGAVLQQENKEANLIGGLFDNLGVSKSRLIIEPNARNTWENGKYLLEIAAPREEENWILVTSAFHMPRSIGVFRKLSWDVIPYPVDFSSHPNVQFRMPLSFRTGLNTIASAAHEWIGLAAYWLTGKSSSLFPEP